MKTKSFKKKLSLKKETISNLARIRGGDITSVGVVCPNSCNTGCESVCYTDCPSGEPQNCNKCN
jgi:hypothetical protein